MKRLTRLVPPPLLRALLAGALVVGVTAASPAAGSAPVRAGTTFDYASAAVPSICGLPSGRLVDGVMPVPASAEHDEGEVRLRPGRRDDGVLTGSTATLYAGTLEAGTTHYCNDTVVLWRADRSVLGAVQLGQVFPGTEHAQVRRVSIERGKVRVQVTDVAQGEGDWMDPIASARLSIGLRSGQVQVLSRTLITERRTVQRFVRAIDRRKTKQARRYATAKVVREALRDSRRADKVSFVGSSCVSRNENGWPTSVTTRYPRMCVMAVRYGRHASGFGLFVGRVAWNRFRIGQIEGIAG